MTKASDLMAAIERAQTVILDDGDTIRFRWIDHNILISWHDLKDAALVDASYVVSLLLILADGADIGDATITSWPDTKQLELVSKYLLKFGDRQYHQSDIENFREAKLLLDSYLLNEERNLQDSFNKLYRTSMNYFEPMTRISKFDWGLSLIQSVNKLSTHQYADIQKSVQRMQQQLTSSFEGVANSTSASLLRLSNLSDQIANEGRSLIDTTNMFPTGFKSILDTFRDTWSLNLPESVMQQVATWRADFLLEMQLQFLLDATDEGVERFTRELQQNSLSSRPDQSTKYIHQMTSRGGFVDDLLTTIGTIQPIASRGNVIREAIKANSARNYYLSVPTLLPQIEALTMELLKHAGYVRWSRKERKWCECDPISGAYLRDRKNKLRPIRGLGSLTGVSSRAHSGLLNEGLPFISGEMSQYRNSILHGNTARYSRSRDSSRLVLLIHTLVNVHARERGK